MKLVIFGATGKIGRNLIDQALSQGHQVTAFTRTPDKLTEIHENLRVKQGDVLDSASVRDAVRGQDGVLCALGMPLMNKEGLREKGTNIIIQIMEEVGVKRLVCLSGLGAGDSWSILPLHYKYLIVPLFMRHLYADHERQESLVKKSLLDWIIVRPGSFIKGAQTGQYRHGFTVADEPARLKVSHEDVAHFMLKQSAENTYLRQTPALSY
ncbi:MAG: SDR family oxidoreductase [Sneathiella sp.]|nr:SDR family oxidoreductase [Sneathiella sp.]